MNRKLTPEELEQFIHRELRALPARKAPSGFEARLHAAVESRTGHSSPATVQAEQLVHRELRALPLRKAPASLEARVFAEIERRAATAWYHKSWSYWPAPVRALFLVFGTAVAGVAITAFWMFTQGATAAAITQEIATGFGWINRLTGAAAWTAQFARQMVGDIPRLWLYGGLAFVAALYATFIGLGTAAYRYLYRNN